MLSDGLNQRAAPNPGAGSGIWIKIVDGAAAGVGAGHSLLGGPDGGVGDWLLELPIHHTGKGTRLVDYTGDGIGERRVTHPVEDYRPYRYLTAVGFPSGLGRDHPRQEADTLRLGGGDSISAAGCHA